MAAPGTGGRQGTGGMGRAEQDHVLQTLRRDSLPHLSRLLCVCVRARVRERIMCVRGGIEVAMERESE